MKRLTPVETRTLHPTHHHSTSTPHTPTQTNPAYTSLISCWVSPADGEGGGGGRRGRGCWLPVCARVCVYICVFCALLMSSVMSQCLLVSLRACVSKCANKRNRGWLVLPKPPTPHFPSPSRAGPRVDHFNLPPAHTHT